MELNFILFPMYTGVTDIKRFGAEILDPEQDGVEYEVIFILGSVNALADMSHVSLSNLAQAFLKSW
jgi:hypothetical protein